MCLMLYLGTDAPVRGFGAQEVAPGEIGLDADMSVRPPVLAGKAVVQRVADRLEGGWNCSCVFLDSGLLPEMRDQDDPDDRAARERAYGGLRRIGRAALAVDPGAVLFSCWSGEEGDPVRVTRHLQPAALQAEAGLFDDIVDGGQGANPPILIHLSEGAP